MRVELTANQQSEHVVLPQGKYFVSASGNIKLTIKRSDKDEFIAFVQGGDYIELPENKTDIGLLIENKEYASCVLPWADVRYLPFTVYISEN